MKKFIIIFLLLTGLAPTVHADDLAPRLESRYNALASWQATFTQTTYIEMLGKNVAKTGKIFVARPDKLKITYITDPNKIYVSNGKKIWVYKESELTAFEFGKVSSVISDEALSFLSGLKNLSQLFDVMDNLNEPQEFLKIKDVTLKKVFLVPKDTQSGILKITLGIAEKNMTVNEAVMFTSSGNVTHYEFKGIEFDKPLASDFFELPKEPKRKIVKK